MTGIKNLARDGWRAFGLLFLLGLGFAPVTALRSWLEYQADAAEFAMGTATSGWPEGPLGSVAAFLGICLLAGGGLLWLGYLFPRLHKLMWPAVYAAAPAGDSAAAQPTEQ